MKKLLPHFWNESTRGFIKCDVYACTHAHKHACISWSCCCLGWRVNANLVFEATICQKAARSAPVNSSELLATQGLAIQGVISYFPSTSTSPSVWHAGGFLQLVRCTIHHFKSIYNALFCTQSEEGSHPNTGKFSLGQALFSLYEQLSLCLIVRRYETFEDQSSPH